VFNTPSGSMYQPLLAPACLACNSASECRGICSSTVVRGAANTLVGQARRLQPTVLVPPSRYSALRLRGPLATTEQTTTFPAASPIQTRSDAPNACPRPWLRGVAIPPKGVVTTGPVARLHLLLCRHVDISAAAVRRRRRRRKCIIDFRVVRTIMTSSPTERTGRDVADDA
jgi:hypothetical protein